MVNELTLQPGCARDSVNRNVNRNFLSRCVFNIVIDVLMYIKLIKLPIGYGNSGLLKVILVNL